MTSRPEAFVQNLVDDAPQTWTEVGTRVVRSSFPSPLKELSVWASTALAEELGDDWPRNFITKNEGRPLLATLLAPFWASYVYRLAEIASQLKVLHDVPGMSQLRADMVGPPSEDSWGHSLLVLSLAGLEYRRSGVVAVEVPTSPGTWHPDVALAGEAGPVLVECFRMVLGAPAIERMKSSASDDGSIEEPIDEWKRIGARLVGKAGQASQNDGWLRCELDSGIFHNIDWYQHSLGTGSLQEKLSWLSTHLQESLSVTGDLAGAVVSSPLMHDVVRSDGDHIFDDGCVAIARNVPGGRYRETFIVPTSADGNAQVEIWTDLYSAEPTWLNWALTKMGLATL